MPTPIFEPYVPKKDDTVDGKIRGLTNAYTETTQYLQWMLQHLDDKNVIRAKSVISDWIYGNIITAEQITSGTITGINISGVYITGCTINGGNITVQQSVNINPSANGGINLGGEGFASIYYIPQYKGIEIQALGGVNLGQFLSYNGSEVATQAWVTANFVHK